MKNSKLATSIVAVVATVFLFATAAQAQENPVGLAPNEENVKIGLKAPGYSPYAGRNFPTKVFWGDTHLHTNLSLDARAFGVILGPEEAYRFARGEEVIASHGERVKLSRPLDWLVISDHSDGMGTMKEIIAGNPMLMRDPLLRDWHNRLNQGGDAALMTTMEVIETFAGVREQKLPDVVLSKEFARTIWDDYLDVAEEYNDPGRFTTIIGYEWTSTPDGLNLHRNVLYRGDANAARQMLPYTTAESFNPEDLWKWMASYEEKTGSQVLTLAHNGNLSNGIMFPETNPETGKRLTREYAEARIRWEPIYEVTQIKGDGEAHPYLSPNDEFAGYELWAKGGLGSPVPKKNDMLQYEYAREALKKGLKLEKKLGVNPYKFGMVGSTDSHTALATAEEENFFGKHSGKEPKPDRWSKLVGKMGAVTYYGWEQVSSGYAAVWATENTREAIFDAMKRKEVYATTGPRMWVRFFGGWDFVAEDAETRLPANVGYAKGVPMGGDLSKAPAGKAPTFLVGALRDPYSGNLDRIQIVKGWLDKGGKLHEKIYDVAVSGERAIGADGRCKTVVGNTVDVKNATWKNTIGEPELITVWKDPDFDPDQRAFYYVRVIEIPTPRWTCYDAVRYGITMGESVPMVTQERAYTSPIWYTP